MTHFIERIQFALFGRSVPAIRVSDIDDDGKVHTIQQIAGLKDRPNSLIATFDLKGYDKDPQNGFIKLIDAQGVESGGYVVSPAGKTISLYVEPRKLPNHEDTVGFASSIDDKVESLNIGNSMRQLTIGIFLGMIPGYLIFTIIFEGLKAMAR